MHRTLAAAAVLLSGCASGHTAADEMPMGPAAATVGFGEAAHLRNFLIAPVRLVEDSRCPASVQCVQAGTVRITAEIRYAEGEPQSYELKLGQPVAHAGWSVVLRDVTPAPHAPGGIAQDAYRFAIETTRR